MGLAKKHRKKFISHKKRWDKRTIEEEAVLVKDYALKNKKEIRRVEYKLAKYKRQAKELNKHFNNDSQEVKNFLDKLKSLGYLPQDANSLDNVLDITLRDILDRRLSNLVYKHKIARTPKQARQFIVHRHIKVAGKVVNSPSFEVPLALEGLIEVVETSSLYDENHPERRLVSEEVAKLKELNEDVYVEEEKEEESFDEREERLDDEEIDEVIE